jgi:hypothetical protein
MEHFGTESIEEVCLGDRKGSIRHLNGAQRSGYLVQTPVGGMLIRHVALH